ncbi:amino acid ABC transporter permease [Halobacteriales archaeon QH_7_65_31]|nr:MAG: amino acid ABC transporter permease [Halobacteriales archaeon QH_7_65_31]
MRDGLVRRVGEAVAIGFLVVVAGIVTIIVSTRVDFGLLETIFPRFVDAFVRVLGIVIAASVLSILLGMFIGLGRISTSPITSRITKGYVEFFRGTPLLFQLFVIYFGIPGLWGGAGFPIPNWEIPAAIIGLTLNHSAYVGEAIRGGIDAVPDGQMEGARSLGMSRVMALRQVVFPQALRNALAAIGNDQIILVKDTSLLTVIAVPELMTVFRDVNSTTFQPWTPLIWVCLFYLVITMSMSQLVNAAERRGDPGRDGSLSALAGMFSRRGGGGS